MITVTMDHPSRTGRDLQAVLGWSGDVVGIVNWTGRPSHEELLPVLNAASRTDKLEQLVRLKEAGVRVPTFFDGLGVPPAGEGWLGRTRNHQQGRDFTTRHLIPDFYVKRLYYDDEWRIHIFKTRRGNYRVLRSGIKLPRRPNFHPWVRSHRLGWKIAYTGGAPESVKEEARKAVEALGLDFAAVDVAATQPPAVLEVNTCPGLDVGTLGHYVNSIRERF